MALPENKLAAVSVPGTFLEPDDVVRANRLEDYCSGGIGLGNPSPNMFAYNWKAWMDGADCWLAREPYQVGEIIFSITQPVEELTDLTMALNKNMDWNAAVGINGTIYFRWYDAQAEDYVITEYPDSCSPRLTLDDKRSAFSRSNDVLFFYLRGTSLYYRQERDRYGVERFLGTYPGILGLGRVGMTDVNRVQVELLYPAAWSECEKSDDEWSECTTEPAAGWSPCQ